MERRFPKSPLILPEETQSGCSWGFRSVFELIFHRHSTRKLLSNTTRFNRDRYENDNASKKNNTFGVAKAKFWDDKAISFKSNEPLSPPSSQTCWPSMLKDYDTNSKNNPNSAGKDSRSTLRGTFHHYLHLKDVRISYGCRNIDVVDTKVIKKQEIRTRQKSEQFLEALDIFSSNKELFLKLVETPDFHRCRARKIKRLLRCKRVVLLWKRTRLRKKLLLKKSRIVVSVPKTEIESFRSYFSFKRWVDKLKRPEHEKTLLSKETNTHNLNRTRNHRKRNLGAQETRYRNSPADTQVHEAVPCTTIFHSEGSTDNTDEQNEDLDSSESSLDSQEQSSLKTKETKDSVILSPNLPPHELDPIHDYVKSVLTAAGLEWDELLMSCQVSDQLLLPILYQQVKFKSGGSDTDSLLLFDYVNEVLLEVYCRHTTKLGVFLAEENVSREAMRCVDWDLVLQNRARTLEQVVKKDLGKFGSWLDEQNGEEEIVVEVVESILEDLIEEIYAA